MGLVTVTYIYAFSRHFYPKQLTVHSGYTFFISMCDPWELNPQPFALLTQCSTTEPQEHFTATTAMNISQGNKYFYYFMLTKVNNSTTHCTLWLSLTDLFSHQINIKHQMKLLSVVWGTLSQRGHSKMLNVKNA